MTLKTYLTDYIGNLADYIDWTTSDALDFVVADTLEIYGVTTETDATDLKKLHAIGKVKLWEKVLTALVSNYDFSADGASFSRSKFFEMAKAGYEMCFMDALQYLPANQIGLGEWQADKQDPYSNMPYGYFYRDL